MCAVASVGSTTEPNAASAVEQGLVEGLAAQERLLHHVRPWHEVTDISLAFSLTDYLLLSLYVVTITAAVLLLLPPAGISVHSTLSRGAVRG